jgi:hypothetical protein
MRLLFALFAAATWLASPVPVNAAEPVPLRERPDFGGVLRSYSRDLASITSDAQALALFIARLGAALDLKDTVGILIGKRPEDPQSKKPGEELSVSEFSDGAMKLTAGLAAWRLASALNQAADADTTAIEGLLRESAGQRDWLLNQERTPHLRLALQLTSALTAPLVNQAVESTPESTPSQEFRDYAAHLDRTYPKRTGSDDSWTAVAERDGAEGITPRLMEHPAGRSDADQRAFASRYFQTRLHPILTARLTALAILAEAHAEQRAREEWRRLHLWQERLMELKGLARLCGTWHWTVHNHQNHQDHKLLISFPPPDVSNGPRPAKIVVLGDTVYLRWEFDRGIVQEDSLLFAGEGQRLEGTFVNSGGPRGSITAKRASACTRGDAALPPTSQREPASTPRPSAPSRR